jgi:hypothetical protein
MRLGKNDRPVRKEDWASVRWARTPLGPSKLWIGL